MTVATEYPTYAELEADIEMEMGLTVSSDGFIDQAEMIHYCNKGIDLGEKIIMNLYKDYFLARDEVTLVDGTEEYAFPSDIYGMKFRDCIFYSGSDVYPVGRCKSRNMFWAYRANKQSNSSTDDEYEYFILNETGGTPKQLFTPTPGTGTIERWYWRQANRITATSDVMDIPEGKELVLAYMRYRVTFKEFKGNPEAKELIQAKKDLDDEIQLLRDTMAEMVVDEANDIEQDHTHYEDHE